MIWGFQYGYKYEYPVYIPALGYFAGAWTGSAVSSITVNSIFSLYDASFNGKVRLMGCESEELR